jgi:hypothetical protein
MAAMLLSVPQNVMQSIARGFLIVDGAPERLHEEISADYGDMIYPATREQIETRRRALIRSWRLKHRAVADSLQEAGDRLFTLTPLPPSQLDRCSRAEHAGTDKGCKQSSFSRLLTIPS